MMLTAPAPCPRGRVAHRATIVLLLIPLLSVLAATTNNPANAQPPPDEQRLVDELDLQTLLNTPVDVWTPTKAPQKSYEAPSIITIVTREQIAVWGHRSMAEVLGHLLGFYIVDDHTAPNVVVRGTSGGLYSDSSLIKVLINGHPVSFSSTGGNGLGPELIPLSAIERVEIIRGPASALYGADAFLALINIQTRQRESVNGGTAWLAMGRTGEKFASDVDLTLGTDRGVIEAMIAFRHTQQDLSGIELPASSPAPNIPDYNAHTRTANGLDQESTSALATVTLRPREGRTLGLFAYYSLMQRGSEFGSLVQLANGYNPRNNTYAENRVSQWQLRSGLQYDESIAERWNLSLRGQYFQGGPRDDDHLEVGSDFYYVRRRYGFRGGDVDAHVEWAPRPGLQLTAGASLFIDHERLPSRIGIAKQPAQELKAGDVIETISVYQGRKLFLNTAAYLQGTWQTFEGRVGLTGGLRYDRHNIYGGQLSRRIGLVGSPRPNLHAKLLHGSAFQAPSPLLLYAVPSASGDVVGNAELKPQYVNTFEFQIEYQPIPSLGLSTDVAYSLIDDKTEFVQQGINKVARNVARVATLSWESKAELKFRDWLNGHVSYELSHTVQRTGQEGYVGQVIGPQGGIYPRMMIHAGLAAQLGSLPMRAAVLGSYIGTRRASGTNILLNAGSYTLPSYYLLEANLATRGFRILRDPAQEVSFSLSGKNLLGATGPTPGFSGVDYPLAPRSLFLQMNLGL
jgi:outer membrane receptor for ferrienterochelin and colicins